MYITDVYFYLSKNFTHVFPNQNRNLQLFLQINIFSESILFFLILTISKRLFITMDMISFCKKQGPNVLALIFSLLPFL